MDKKKNTFTTNSLLSIDLPLKIGLGVILGLALLLILLQLFSNPLLAGLSFVVLAAFTGLAYYSFRSLIQQTNKYLYDLSFRADRGQQEALINIPIGILLYRDDEARTIEWINPKLQNYFGKEDLIGISLTKINSQLTKLTQAPPKQTDQQVIKIKGAHFQAFIQTNLRVIYLLDITTYLQMQQQYEDGRIAIGQIFLDNYDELTQTMADRDRSNLNNYLTNKLNDWANLHQMFIKRVNDDRFLAVAYVKNLQQIEAEGFKILDTVRQDTSQQNFPLTLSIGFAYGQANLAQIASESQKNLDLALGRGGDQVVVRKGEAPAHFYGGNTNPMEKRTRVRARMISQALRELFNHVDQLYVMGHQNADMDSLGACLGIHRIAQMNDKPCSIVIDPTHVHTDIQRLLNLIAADENLKDDILTPQQALEQAGDHDMLVLVDVSKPSMSMSPKLCKRLADRTVIIDHHRRGEEFPDNPILAYIEPYASSASELVTEMLEYQPQSKQSLSKLEATALLAGISVDTHSFTMRAGTRTFDAASYLRSMGADGTEIQNLLKENIDSYLQRNQLIAAVEMLTPHIAICAGAEQQIYDPVVAAQAADTLLSLSHIEASFVITKSQEDLVRISARSLGNFNVQLIMEEMGGGGHLSNAATQISGATIAQVHQKLIAIIQKKVEDKK